MKNDSKRCLAVGQSRLDYSQGRSIPSPSFPLVVVSDSANYNKGEHALNTAHWREDAVTRLRRRCARANDNAPGLSISRCNVN